MTVDTYGGLYKGDLDELAKRIGPECVYRVRTNAI
jgi:hypothetical protein